MNTTQCLSIYLYRTYLLSDESPPFAAYLPVRSDSARLSMSVRTCDKWLPTSWPPSSGTPVICHIAASRAGEALERTQCQAPRTELGGWHVTRTNRYHLPPTSRRIWTLASTCATPYVCFPNLVSFLGVPVCRSYRVEAYYIPSPFRACSLRLVPPSFCLILKPATFITHGPSSHARIARVEMDFSILLSSSLFFSTAMTEGVSIWSSTHNL